MANVGYATLQIIPSARGFSTALNGQVAPAMTGVGSSSGKKFGAGMLASFKSFAGPLAAVAGTAAIGSFFKTAITGASDLQETISKSNVIFGDASGSVEKFAKDASRNILLTTQQAIDASATFGIFGKSAGLVGKPLANFSTDLTALASDLSSFSNTTTDEAITAIGAALRGESEPIRRYGVLLDDASLRQEALRQGLVKTTKEALTPQTRVLAAQALIFRQTKDAQGDAARTSAGFANQQRILAKNFQDIKVEVGTALLPAITALTSLISNNLKPAFEGIKTVAAPIIDFFKSFGTEGGKANGAASQLKNTLEAYKSFIGPLVDTLRQLGETAGKTLGPAFKSLADVYVNNFLPAVQAILPVLRPIAQFFLKVFGSAVIGVLRGAIGVIKGLFKTLAGVLNVFAGVFTGDWRKLWTGVKQIFSGLWDAIKGLFLIAINGGILKVFRTAGTLIINVGKAIFAGLRSIFSSGLSTLVNLVKAYPGAVLNVFSSGKNLLLQAGRDIISGFLNGIKSMGSSIISTIKSTITDALPDFVKKALGIASPSKVFAEIGKNVGLGFVKGVQGTEDRIKSTFDKLAEDVKKSGSKKLIKAVADTQKRILDLAGRRDVLKDRYAEAKTNLRDLKQEAADYAKSVRDSIVATGNISTSRSFDSIVRNLTVSLDKATEFNKVVAQLKNSGLNNTALSQLVEQGPAGALNAARALLASGSVGIATVNSLQAELQKQGNAIGDTISGSIYKASIQDAEKTVGQIAKDLTSVEDKIVSVAAALAREIAKIGKIDAPEWLKNLTRNTDYTASRTQGAPKSPNMGGRSDAAFDARNGNNRTVVVNNFNPVAEKTSVTVSNTLTRLAILGIG